MSHTIDDLRNHLFETLQGIRDRDNPLDLDRARAVADVAKVLVDSAKVEVDFLKATGGGRGSGFIPEREPAPSRELHARTVEALPAARPLDTVKRRLMADVFFVGGEEYSASRIAGVVTSALPSEIRAALAELVGEKLVSSRAIDGEQRWKRA